MTDKPSNYDLDDELLSAYLDGELSADESAAVEARLATDPAAQQLLHELRSVSQSVQGLPTESLGRDLSEEIIRRARQAKPGQGIATSAKTSSTNESSRLSGEAMPKIRIFHSKRAWIWASMALAAGLLMMFVQSGDDATNKLPPVAARDREGAPIQPADESGQSVRRQVSISATPESPTPPPAAVAFDSEVHEKIDALGKAAPSAPMAGEAGGGQLGPGAPATPAFKLRKEAEPTVTELDDASGTSRAVPSQVAADKSTTAPQPTGRIGGAAGSPGMAAEKQKSESLASPSAQRFTVVRVVARPESLKNGSVERLLSDNKIEFVSAPATNEPLSFSGGKLAKPVQSKSDSKEQSNKAAEILTAKTEMVLVEAPAPTIESCLADINKNANDFLSIAVSEEPVARDRFDAKSTPAKKLAENQINLSRFNRGATRLAQKDTIDLYNYYYSHDFGKLGDSVKSGSPPVGGFGNAAGTISGAEPDANGDRSRHQGQPISEVRRARSIEAWNINDRKADEPQVEGGAARGPAGAAAPKQPMSQRTSSDGIEAKVNNQSDNWKVLFVFTPDEASTPSAPAANPPK